MCDLLLNGEAESERNQVLSSMRWVRPGYANVGLAGIWC